MCNEWTVLMKFGSTQDGFISSKYTQHTYFREYTLGREFLVDCVAHCQGPRFYIHPAGGANRPYFLFGVDQWQRAKRRSGVNKFILVARHVAPSAFII